MRQTNNRTYNAPKKSPVKLYIGLAIAALVIIYLIIRNSNNDDDPAVRTLDKAHAIEVTYETKHLPDSSVLLITHQNIYVKNQLVKSIVRNDTLPALGDSLQTMEDETSSENARIPKEYEFFVTIK